mmetsp:Transcript_2986/g.5449  ORF Transcript_2986/g.5449 Transcript_2986/m.5449 type:complete len:411 (+) Transcript_2986:89-1321(+)
MAPKTSNAGKSATKGTKSRASILKKPAAASRCSGEGRRITVSQCRSIVAAMDGAEELPKNVRNMLASLVEQNLSDSQHPYQEGAMAVVGEALTDIEARLSSEWEEAKAEYEADADKSAREEALQQAESYISEQKQSIIDLKQAIKESAQAVTTAQEELNGAKMAQKSTHADKKRLEAKMMQLQTAEKDTYQPLKEASASGQKGTKSVKLLRKVGKDFGFHDVLMSVMPFVLKKQPDRRRTFDGITMQQLESEFSKHGAALEAALKEREAVMEESSEAVQAAHAAVQDAKTQHSSNSKALTQAEDNLVAGKSALLDARRRVRTFDSELRKSERDLASKASRLQAFQQGPLAAFRELSNRAPVDANDVSMKASDEEFDSDTTQPGMEGHAVTSAGSAGAEEEMEPTIPGWCR